MLFVKRIRGNKKYVHNLRCNTSWKDIASSDAKDSDSPMELVLCFATVEIEALTVTSEQRTSETEVASRIVTTGPFRVC